MWTLSQFDFPGDETKAYACDGYPIINHPRGNEGVRYRFVAGTLGYLDIVDLLKQPGGPEDYALTFNGQLFWYSGEGSIEITIHVDGTFTVSGNGNLFSHNLHELPLLEGPNVDGLRQMVTMKIVPYQNPPSGQPKTDAELQALADTYFPDNHYGFDMAMAIYDWTSANFIRQDLFHQLQYTGIDGHPLDLATIARVIWGCDYPGYSPSDPNFMNQFTMKPASSEADVYEQLLNVYQTIKPLAIAEMNVLKIALLNLNQPTVAAYPQLYRGAMPMTGGYNTSDFSPSMFEYGGNAGPISDPLVQAFNDALEDTLAPGRIITTKGPWSFSNDLDGAKVWQNGILITCNPPEGAIVWPSCADITPFSLNPDTFEINVPAVSRYRINSYEWITIKDKPVCHFTMTMLGYSVEPF
ncbi:MAG: hypothetical protein AAF546_14325 [Verrucomicrobiota bacterium]